MANRLAATWLRRLGGPLGHHAGRIAPVWAYVLATASWVVLMLRQIPCRQTGPGSSPDRFGWMCYTDLTALYYTRGQATGGIPYVNVTWEYPVLTGYFATAANAVAGVVGAVLRPGISGDQMVANANVYFAVSAVGLFACFLWLVSTMVRLVPGNPALAMVVAVAPAVWTCGLINWDLIPVALTAAGLLAWVEDRPIWAGLWWGLGVAAKLYPVVIIGALIVVCWRRGQGRARFGPWAAMAGTAAVTWVVVNLPVMATHRTGWAYFYTANAARQADLGSLWYALKLMGVPLHEPALWSRGLMIAGYAGLALLIFLARTVPTAAQIAFLAVIVMATGNLVYSPQYVLWLLPLLVLAQRNFVDWVLFSLAELVYYGFIWLYLHGTPLGFGSPTPWLYVGATLLRLIVSWYVMARVVGDCLRATPRVAGRAEV